jgi:hypothetical protein
MSESIKEKLARQKKKDKKLIQTMIRKSPTELKEEKKEKKEKDTERLLKVSLTEKKYDKVLPRTEGTRKKKGLDEDIVRKVFEDCLKDNFPIERKDGNKDIQTGFNIFETEYAKEKIAEKKIEKDDEDEFDNENEEIKSKSASISKFKSKSKSKSKEDKFDTEDTISSYIKNNFDEIVEEWGKLSEIDKIDYELRALMTDTNFPSRKSLINNIRSLPPDLRLDFMEKYIKQEEDYQDYYKYWVSNKEISKQIDEYNMKKEKEDLDIVSKSRADLIKDEIMDNAREYLGISVDATPYYSKILSLGEEKTGKSQSKLHSKFAKKFIDEAKSLGIPEPEKLNIKDLADMLASKERTSLERINPSYFQIIKDMDHDELVKEAKKLKIKSSKKLDRTLLIKELLERKRGNKVEKEKISSVSHKHKKLKIIENDEAGDYAYKLAKITGKHKSFYRYWSLNELKQRMEAIERGEHEEWQDLDREAIIDSLVELTKGNIEDYKDRSTYSLKKELETSEKNLEQSLKIQKNHTAVRKCVRNFKDFKWIKGNVTDIYISGDENKIHNYAFVEDGYVKMYDRFFYRPNARFFNLQCNTYSGYRVQNKNTLTCYEVNGEPIDFVVAYVGTYFDNSYYGIYTGMLGSGPLKGYRAMLQTKKIFEDEKIYMKKYIETRNEKIEKLLNQKIDKNSLSIASKVLSGSLQYITLNKVPDYLQDSAFINVAIASSIKPEDTNRTLFTNISKIVVFLRLPVAKLFHKRIQAQYYLPEILMTLSDVEKLPEVYDPDYKASQKTIETMTSYIERTVSSLVYECGEILYRYYDPTDKTYTRTMNDSIFPTIKYDKSVCVNSEDLEKIDQENLAFYQDPETNGVYCLDSEVLSVNFEHRNFLNPHTGNKFEKSFIQRYFISYYDKLNNKVYTFPYQKILKQFDKKNYVNEQTNRLFDPSFVKDVLGGQMRSSIYYRGRVFKKTDIKTSKCKNKEDVLNQPPENILYYKDPEDKALYCFPIDETIRQFSQGNERNPKTGKAFSSTFVKYIKNTYNLKGVDISVSMNKLKQKQEEVKEEFIIPDLWNQVVKSVNELRGVKEADDSGAEEEGEEGEEDSGEESGSSGSEGESGSSGESSGSKDSKSEQSSSVEANFGMGKTVASPTISPVGTSPIGSPVGTSPICSSCKKEIIGVVQYKSIGLENDTPVIYSFCCLDCLEKMKFPTFKKIKSKKRRSKKN